MNAPFRIPSGHDQAAPGWGSAAGPRARALVAAALLAIAAGCGDAGTAPAPPRAADHAGAGPGVAGRPRAVVWAVGDGADGGDAARSVPARIASGRVDRVLYLGDVYEEGTASDFATNYASTYGGLAARTAPTPGNHDWPRHPTGYDPYWRRALGHRLGHWYAFRAAGWQLLSLNSEAPHGPGSPQLRWLARRLRAGGTCRIAFWHRPRFSASTHHGDQPDVAPLWNALRGRAAIVLGGHDHDMQRFRPIGGITQFVSGAGGHGLYSLHDDRRLAFGDDTSFGALRLVLSPSRADYAFVAADGRVLDRGTIGCRPARRAR
jgi:Calcineurin-like phosphoesterase